MHITTWLDTLPPKRRAAVDADLKALADQDACFLSDMEVSHQVERLSGYLGDLRPAARQAVIGYSLYTRQLDRVQDAVSKAFCRDSCDRPPVGCCNANHCDIFSPSDYFLYHPTPLSLELGQAVTRLQRIEDEWAQSEGAGRLGRYCRYLSDRGCTLALFKSPRCVHYLCQTLRDDLTERHGEAGKAFGDAMAETANRAVASCADFTNPAVLQAARQLLPA